MIRIPEDELWAMTSTELARKYGCSAWTVRHMRMDLRRAGTVPRTVPRTLPEEEQAKRTPEERRIFGLLVACYSRAMQAGVPWNVFIQCFRRQLPALLAHTEDIPDGIRVFGAEVQTSPFREAI